MASRSPTGGALRRLFATPKSLGSLPHVWLAFLGFYLFPMLFMGPGDWRLWASLAGLAVFLPFYYAAFRREGSAILRPTAAIIAIATVLSPINAGANVFYNYAAFFVGQATSARRALLLTLGICALIAVNALILDLRAYYYGPGILVSLGLVGISINERQRQLANSALCRSQEEVHRLAQLAERERIARDLHDVVGHTLSTITLKAQLAGRLLPDDPDACAREIVQIEAASRDALANVRATISGYRRVGLDEELDEARRVLESAGVALDASIDDLDLSARHESMFALLLREAVTNVVRHANADHCVVSLARTDAGLRLTVRDDGIGFDGDDGQGLTGMRERLAAVGGRLRFGGGPGTTLIASVPVGSV